MLFGALKSARSHQYFILLWWLTYGNWHWYTHFIPCGNRNQGICIFRTTFGGATWNYRISRPRLAFPTVATDLK